MVNFVRVTLADRAGNVRDELRVLPDEVVWRLNDVGRVRFTLPWNHAFVQAGWLEPGNIILLQFENGLPLWGGVIDLPQRWDGLTVEVTAYSGEYLLGFRYTDKGRYFDGASPGAIFTALIDEGNAVEPVGVVPGSVYMGGGGHSPDYHLGQVLKLIKDSVVGRLSGYDFAVIPALSGGRITFAADLYQRRGAAREAALVQDRNLTGMQLNRQGPIYNDITIAGADISGEGADGWGDGRILSSASDAESINTYGRRQYGAVFSDVSIQATLDGHAARILAENKRPRNVWTLAALNRSPGRFADYDVGDDVHLRAPRFGVGGFSGRARVLGRAYDAESGTCELLVQEWVA